MIRQSVVGGPVPRSDWNRFGDRLAARAASSRLAGALTRRPRRLSRGCGGARSVSMA